PAEEAGHVGKTSLCWGKHETRRHGHEPYGVFGSDGPPDVVAILPLFATGNQPPLSLRAVFLLLTETGYGDDPGPGEVAPVYAFAVQMPPDLADPVDAERTVRAPGARLFAA
ncbi:hypothetical protein, partial [Streptomyces sp. UG1]|uniref:hypothetical protein n=1 Tax=Streptomyces sp. UG1 TaxID=3417652 RepID=UPI003CF50EA0